MKHQAPPVLSPLEFSGLEGQLILIQLTEWKHLVDSLPDECTIVSSPSIDDLFIDGKHLDSRHIAIRKTDMIGDAVRMVEVLKENSSITPYHFIIHRVDMMNLNYSPRDRGRLLKGMIMKLTPRVLGKSNVFITSETDQPALKEMCDKFYDLRMPA